MSDLRHFGENLHDSDACKVLQMPELRPWVAVRLHSEYRGIREEMSGRRSGKEMGGWWDVLVGGILVLSALMLAVSIAMGVVAAVSWLEWR